MSGPRPTDTPPGSHAGTCVFLESCEDLPGYNAGDLANNLPPFDV